MIQEVLRGPTTPSTVIQDPGLAKSTNKFYLAVWRWHFYAGVYVVPFLIMLALTGLTMLFHKQIEAFQYANRLFVPPVSQMISEIGRSHV